MNKPPTTEQAVAPPTTMDHLKKAAYLAGIRFGQARYWELDYLRALAIVWMVVFHLLWDLDYFGLIPGEIFNAYMSWPGLRVVFFFLVGVSLTISYRRTQLAGLQGGRLYQKYLLRGLATFVWGMVITLVVTVAGTGSILFGTLHSIGLSVMIAYPLLRFTIPNLFVGVGLIALGWYLSEFVSVGFSWLLWLGFQPVGYTSLDYFPLLPWFGVVCLGIFVGNLMYAPAGRRFRLPDLPDNRALKTIQLIGSNALPIYLIHQPILFGIVALAAAASG